MNINISNYFSQLISGQVFSALQTMYPCILHGVKDQETFKASSDTSSSYYGFVYEGSFELSYGNTVCRLPANSFFCCPQKFEIKSLSSKSSAIIIERRGYHGLFQVGLVEEEGGRLCYIDNASTTILIPPPRLGDPVLNLLVFPENIVQTPHIHPTIRLGMVFEGSGECLLSSGEKIPLTPGLLFYLPERIVHSFNSHEKGLKIIAFHPDSDVGPTDSSHPMLSRTYKV